MLANSSYRFSLLQGLVALALSFASAPTWAYYDVLDTGEILPNRTYKLTGDAQLLTEQGGLDIGAIFDMGFQDQYGFRALLGFGRTDYYLGALFKWMPIPDVQGQPAVGFNVGLLDGHSDGNSDLTIRFEPLVSKKFAAGSTILTPYASVPLGIRMRTSDNNDNSTDLAWQLAIGSQLQIEQWKYLQFMAELALDLSHAASSISLAAVWYFDMEHGFQLK